MSSQKIRIKLFSSLCIWWSNYLSLARNVNKMNNFEYWLKDAKTESPISLSLTINNLLI